MVLVFLRIGSNLMDLELDLSTTLTEIVDFLQDQSFVEGQPIALQSRGQMFNRGTDTIDDMVGNLDYQVIQVFVGNEIQQHIINKQFANYQGSSEQQQFDVDMQSNKSELIKVTIKLDKQSEDLVIDPATTLSKMTENLVCLKLMKDQQKIIIEIQGKIYKDLSLTIGSLIDGKQKEIIVKILADDNQISQCRLNSTIVSQLNNAQPFNTNQRQVQGKRDEPNLRRVKLQQSKNSLASRPVTAVQQMRPISKLTFQNYQTQVKTQVQLTSDQTFRQAIELLSKLIGVPAQSILIQLLLPDISLNSKLEQFRNVNHVFTYQLNNQVQQIEQGDEICELSFEITIGIKTWSLIMEVNRQQTMIEMKNDIMDILGYNNKYADIDYYVNGQLIQQDNLQNTPTNLGITNIPIQVIIKEKYDNQYHY